MFAIAVWQFPEGTQKIGIDDRNLGIWEIITRMGKWVMLPQWGVGWRGMVYHPTDSLTVRLFARVGGRSFLPTSSLAGPTLAGGILMETRLYRSYILCWHIVGYVYNILGITYIYIYLGSNTMIHSGCRMGFIVDHTGGRTISTQTLLGYHQQSKG